MSDKKEIIRMLEAYGKSAEVKDLEEIRDRLNHIIFSQVKGTPKDLIQMVNKISADAWHAETAEEAKEVIQAVLDAF